MDVVETIAEVRAKVARARQAGKTVGLMPTLGGMHEGHFRLVDATVEACDYVVVSVFLNPTQFAPGEDLDSYPLSPDDDLDGCRAHGVDLVFRPSAEEMYPREPLTEVSVGMLSKTLCGRRRPGHFAGVCTVVTKLLNIVQPDVAVFGQKDYQQAAILRRMVSDLNLPVEIRTCPTVREDDGLAISSRNRYLTPAHRSQAPALYGALRLGRELIIAGERSAKAVARAMADYLAEAGPAGEIDYLEVVDPETLQPVEAASPPVLLAGAVRWGPARLIDNMLVEDRPQSG